MPRRGRHTHTGCSATPTRPWPPASRPSRWPGTSAIRTAWPWPSPMAASPIRCAMIDKHPAAIVRCRDTADVVACVRFAREHGVEIAVRGGGHNAAGLAVSDDALVIDLSGLRSTNVDPQRRTVRADAGCTWGDVDHATVAFGMATPSGFLSSTGVAGLTLGGGIGYLARRFGLTVDNLLAADVVLADGTFVTASENSHSDLFWALRGGGGNFGVVTSFTFRCHDIGEHGTIIGGPVLYDFADTAEVMRWYRELLPSLPEELSGWIGLITILPHRRSRRRYGAARPARSSGATPGRTTRRTRSSNRSGRTAHRCSPACTRCLSPCCKARSTASTRRGCTGTGRRTSSARSPTRRSMCTSPTAGGCRPAIPPCTCTRSTVPPAACPRTRRPSPTGTAAGPASSWASTRTPPTRIACRNGRRTTGGRCTRCRPAAPTSTS